MEILDITLVGINAENGRKLLLAITVVLVLWTSGRGCWLRSQPACCRQAANVATARSSGRGRASSSSPAVQHADPAMWARQILSGLRSAGISLASTTVELVGVPPVRVELGTAAT